MRGRERELFAVCKKQYGNPLPFFFSMSEDLLFFLLEGWKLEHRPASHSSPPGLAHSWVGGEMRYLFRRILSTDIYIYTYVYVDLYACLQELFGNIGPVKRASVNCDENGKSKGSAEVIFSRKADALRAIKEYSGRQLDGQPLKIDMVQSVAAAVTRTNPTVPVKVTPAPRVASAVRGAR